MIQVNDAIQLGENEITERFVLSRGPGGQNANKTATTVQLRFDVDGSPSIDDDVKERLYRIAGNRIDKRGHLLIRARRHRTLERNRRDARDRLVKLVRRAAERQKPRRARRGPSRKSIEKRLADKHFNTRRKAMRAKPTVDSE